jgi:hypothetical protein
VLGPTYRIDDDTMQRYGLIVAAEGQGLGVLLGMPDTRDQLEAPR